MNISTPTSFYEFMMTLDGDHRFVLMIVLIMGVTFAAVCLAIILTLTVRSLYKHRLNDSLKRELLDRGLSAEEIERVVSVRVGSRPKMLNTGQVPNRA